MIKYVFRQRRRVGGKKVMAKTYSGRYKIDGEQKISTIALGVTDKQVAERKLAEIVAQREREQAGVAIPPAIKGAAAQSLEGHFADFIVVQKGLRRNPKYLKTCALRLTRLSRECRWKNLRDITPASFEAWRSKQTCAVKTVNQYQDTINVFLKWMWQSGKLAENPLIRLKKADARGQEVRKRRAFTDEEIERLLAVAGDSRIGYLLAVETGLRRSELKNLQWGWLELDGEKPTILLPASAAKNRKETRLPLPPHLSGRLRQMRPTDYNSSDVVLSGVRLPSMEKMKEHLKAAGIEFIVDGKRADFHALRHTLNTNLGKAGVSLSIAMMLMRHSDSKLTTRTYMDATMLPLANAQAGLPVFGVERPTLPKGRTHGRTQTPDIQEIGVARTGAAGSGAIVPHRFDNEELSPELASDDAACPEWEGVAGVGFEPTTFRL